MAAALPSLTRCTPVGAEVEAERGGAHFRVWAPQHRIVKVVFEGRSAKRDLDNEGNGYFSGFIAGAGPGSRYKFELEAGEAYPDPASRYQPKGPHGWSEVVDPAAFRWSDRDWPGIKLPGQIIYELHLGTFTAGGTWLSAAEKLEYLRDTGITSVEVLPVANFPGKFGWGYDGVQLYAPASIYGVPNDMRLFVDRAHALGIGVILDVVYNHLGPDGNYLTKFSPFYFTKRHKTDWGEAINFDGEESGPVREFFRENAAYWIREFHLDGLRLDATQDIHDDSDSHILAEISGAVRRAAGERSILLVAENEPQNTRLIKPTDAAGYGLDALWNDDFHHTAMVALTGKVDAYYNDYRGTAQELLSSIKHGYLFQGQWYSWQKKRRGSPAFGLPRPAMINFIQNHDQVANSARGLRIDKLTSPGMFKAITALTLLAPATPMLFQGQEFGASSPFLFFADHKPDLAQLIKTGRLEFLGQWRSFTLPEMQKCFADPHVPETFERCKLDFSEVERHADIYALHRDLLRLRREDPILSRQGADGIDGAVLSPQCFVVRFFSPTYEQDRLLLINLGIDLNFNPAPEPLLAPPASMEWVKVWSSEDPPYGGCGTALLDTHENWIIPGQAAVFLKPRLLED
ncbi:MAG: malto-oligosyltrehalose trehalohydrolase [Acidobacteriaceae bacterium]|nr:malto-oligosyltrehalose trehalohydrolase [Acidobacteriaceae bacterium]MBV9779555.1 malto-oligosyltrehalose trehalohydrolase [Acidobacteriaceae bacterium]